MNSISMGMLQELEDLRNFRKADFVLAISGSDSVSYSAGTEMRHVRTPDFGDFYRFWRKRDFDDWDPTPVVTAEQMGLLTRALAENPGLEVLASTRGLRLAGLSAKEPADPRLGLYKDADRLLQALLSTSSKVA